jgi:hypothetical protein
MRHSLLYVTQAEPHDITPGRTPLDAAHLRAYLMLYGMFFDQLMVSDSQFIGNPELRSLLWDGETDVKPDVQSDLAILLDRKVLVPAIRDTVDSLHDVWQDHINRSVEDVSDERYIHFVEEHLGGQGKVVYQASAVSSFFRDQVLATFAPDNRALRLKNSIRQAVHDYVLDQETLFYIGLRQWMNSQVEQGRMENYHRAKIDLAVAAAYRHNIPKAVKGSLIDVPLDPKQLWTPIDIRLGRESVIREVSPQFTEFPVRPFAVSPYVLGKLPTETLLAIRADPARRPVMKQLNEFQRTGTVDAQRLAGDLEAFIYSAEQIAYASARGELRDLIKRCRRERAGARITVARDAGLAVAGLSIWGLVSNVAGYVGLAVTAYASIQALRHQGERYRHGYAIGRAMPDEHRLLLSHPDTKAKARQAAEVHSEGT